jgi:Domain of unknown function (DUF4438)
MRSSALIAGSSTTRVGTNRPDLVLAVVMGQIAHPVGRATAYRIGQDGVPRILPGTGGISINQRIGDRCVGIEGDHVEPGVSLHNNGREVIGPRNGPNQALMTYACCGNRARVVSGPCLGAWGLVTGKHGGVSHVMVDFPPEVMARLRIGDRIQIYSIGQGLRLPEFPDVTVSNCSPTLLARWGLRPARGALRVPVTHLLPAGLLGSGLGKNTVWRGDVDIQLFDSTTRRRWRLSSLRYGDLIAVGDLDARFGPAYRRGRTTIGVIVHSDSSVSGHGPGMMVLLTGPSRVLRPIHDPNANLAVIFGRRDLVPARPRPKLGEVHIRERIRAPALSD